MFSAFDLMSSWSLKGQKSIRNVKLCFLKEKGQQTKFLFFKYFNLFVEYFALKKVGILALAILINFVEYFIARQNVAQLSSERPIEIRCKKFVPLPADRMHFTFVPFC